MPDYDGSVALDRKLTEDEIREIKITLLPYFHASGSVSDEDITDLLDYTFAMISNEKTIEYIIQELIGMEMEFCKEEVAHKVGAELSKFVAQLTKGESNDDDPQEEEGGEGSGNRVVSLKSKEDNALTMAGALGASRERGSKGNNKDKKEKQEKKDKRDASPKRRDDRREGKGRSRQGEAFDRLARGGGRGNRDGGRGGNRDRRREDRREDRRDVRGRGRRDDRREDRREDRRRRDHDDGDDRGNKRRRDDGGDEEFYPMEGGRGRGRGDRGRGGRGGGRDGGGKWQKYDDGYGQDESYGYDNSDYGYGYNDGYGRGGRGRFGSRGGRFGGRGRSGRGGRGGQDEAGSDANMEGGGGDGAADAAGHPSPMVQANFGGGYSGGRGYSNSYGGRGFYRGGRGGRGGGRSHVVSMIQSKTWVRKKDGEDGGDGAAPAPEG